MKFAFIDEEKAHWPIEMLCAVLSVSRSGYYAWKTRPTAPRVLADALLVEDIKVAYAIGRGGYGSPRVLRQLRKHGKRVGKKRVERLMRREAIRAVRRRKFRTTTDSKHADPIAPNILDRDFSVELPNTAWVTDVTYVWTHQGWLYLAAILDLCSRRVVGWATGANNDRQLALDALEHAVADRKPLAGMLRERSGGARTQVAYGCGRAVAPSERVRRVAAVRHRFDVRAITCAREGDHFDRHSRDVLHAHAQRLVVVRNARGASSPTTRSR